MRNLVSLRDKVSLTEDTKREAEGRVSEIMAQLQQERSRRENAESALRDKEDERLKLNEELLELQNAKMNLEQVIAQNMEKTDRMERGMQMVAIERDETLELLQRAVRQKEEIRMNRRKEVEEVQEEVEQMRSTALQDQGEVKRLLSTVDQLLAKFGRGETRITTDALHELVVVRDGMRQLVKSRGAMEEKQQQLGSGVGAAAGAKRQPRPAGAQVKPSRDRSAGTNTAGTTTADSSVSKGSSSRTKRTDMQRARTRSLDKIHEHE